jgi:hypothetical protein
MGSQEDIGGQDREREGAEWSEEEMRDSMDEWNRAVEARAGARIGIGIEDGQASDEGGALIWTCREARGRTKKQRQEVRRDDIRENEDEGEE